MTKHSRIGLTKVNARPGTLAKAKIKDFNNNAKAEDLTLKAKAKDMPFYPRRTSRSKIWP